jgi:hypothetical protein
MLASQEAGMLHGISYAEESSPVKTDRTEGIHKQLLAHADYSLFPIAG